MFSADSTQVATAAATPGSLWLSGSSNDYGEQGLNMTSISVTGVPLTAPISGVALTNWSAPNGGSASGTGSNFFIKADGSLWGVGSNGTSELGIDNFSNQPTPIFVDAGPWVWVANTNNVSAGIKSDGTLWTWGMNIVGQLGLNDTTNRTVPTKVGARTDWVQVRCMVNSMVALRSDNTMWGWGANNYGQLATGTATKINKSSPIQIAGSWSSISSTSQSAVFGIRTDGSLWSWGRNASGTLGLSLAVTTGNRSSPIQIGTATDWAEVNPLSDAVLARKTNGQVWAWGLGTSGQLGDNARISRSSPVQVAFGGTAAWAGPLGDYQGLIVDNSGNAWTWGNNDVKKSLWDNTTASRSSPVQIGTGYAPRAAVWWAGSQSKVPSQQATIGLKTDGTAVFATSGSYFWVYNAKANQPTTTSYGTSPVWAHGKTAMVLASGSAGTGLFAIKSDGTLWAWGTNTDYILGLGDTFPRSSPVQVGVATTWSNVSGGWRFSGAVKTDGTLWMWGSNQTGSLGNGLSSGTAVSPLQIGALTNWANVTCSPNSTAGGLGSTTLAVKTDGTLWGWGGNDTGQIGDNSVVNRSSPVQVGVAVGAQFNWKQVTVNGSTTASDSDTTSLGVKTDGTLWSWGAGKWGMSGRNTLTQINYPVQVGALTNWSKVVAGQIGVVAIKTDGTLWTWGNGDYGANGDGTVLARSSPVQVGALTDWVDCYRAYSTTIGVRSNGTLWIWGKNEWVKGSYAATFTSSPVQVTSGTSTGTTGWKNAIVIGANYASWTLLATKE